MEDPHTGTDISCLTFSQSAWLYDRFNFLRLCFCQRFYIRIFCIKIFYHYVYSGICTLRCKAYTDQKLPRLIIIQGASRIGIFVFQSLNYFQSPLFFCHKSSSFLPVFILFLLICFSDTVIPDVFVQDHVLFGKNRYQALFLFTQKNGSCPGKHALRKYTIRFCCVCSDFILYRRSGLLHLPDPDRYMRFRSAHDPHGLRRSARQDEPYADAPGLPELR